VISKAKINKAMLLAAGRGSRMGGLTEELPKPMLPLNGRPMIEHIVRRLQEAGLREILIVVGYRRELIKDHFRAGFSGVSFVVQELVEGTASAVKLGRDFAGIEPFLLTFGDIICDASNYSGIAAELERHGASAAVGVKYADDPWQGAAVYADAEGAVRKMIEKPARGTSATHWNSAGLYAFRPEIFKEIATAPKSQRGEYEITTAIEQLVERGRPVRMFEMTGAWRDVGRPEDLAEADKIV
jgi:UDP-N-acetylglucosamine diphosphorylase / glucose-1-phosphate thymidylyltransferase / UDP-N-acetylgalactosamine diphosphorylase / glucosamine-1-phosphate N-acetyltransferase / galactosamine-1-phosphate N-acetyltransferase